MSSVLRRTSSTQPRIPRFATALMVSVPLVIVCCRDAPVIPDTLDALDALNGLREAEVPMALVHDEYGHFDGVVTPADVIDAIAGAFRSDEPPGTREGDPSRQPDPSVQGSPFRR